MLAKEVRCGSAIARTKAVVERIRPLAERRCQHPVLASVEQQVADSAG
jgi:hypothetical protein